MSLVGTTPWKSLGIGPEVVGNRFAATDRDIYLIRKGVGLPKGPSDREQWLNAFLRSAEPVVDGATSFFDDTRPMWLTGRGRDRESHVWFVNESETGINQITFFRRTDQMQKGILVPDLLATDLQELSGISRRNLEAAHSFEVWPFWHLGLKAGAPTTTFFEDDSERFAVVASPTLPADLQARKAWRDDTLSLLRAKLDGAVAECASDDRSNNGRALRAGLIALPLNPYGTSGIGIYSDGDSKGGNRGLIEAGMELLSSLTRERLEDARDSLTWLMPDMIMFSD